MVLLSVSAAAPPDLKYETEASLPAQVVQAFTKAGLSELYAFSAHLNPFFVQGDFNGDGKLDTAILVKQRTTQKIGVAIVHSGSLSVVILAAGREFGNGGDDFSWMDAWHAFPKGEVSQGAAEGSPPRLRGDALMVIKTESASALIYWTGKNYAWYQQGD